MLYVLDNAFLANSCHDYIFISQVYIDMFPHLIFDISLYKLM